MAKRWRVLPNQLDEMSVDDYLDIRAEYKAEVLRQKLAEAERKPVEGPPPTPQRLI